ncbi:MAG: hypothetical protein PHD76_10070 [Methylacidiphilales bacterium]|nr:hypothetical protein [Candidatus Methylacidiphilales bacterium]
MKNIIRFTCGSSIQSLLLCAGLIWTGHSLQAADEAAAKTDSTAAAPVEAAPAEAPTYNNWIDVGFGGQAVHGDGAQYNHNVNSAGDVFGGLNDLHIEQTVGPKGLFSVDGRAIVDNNDYKLKLQYSDPDWGYIQAGFTQFRTWYDGHGGFFPINGRFFNLYDNQLALDRGSAWVELGLRIENLPEITLRYEHEYRDGQKDSTLWGPTTMTGLATSRLIVPAFRDIDEQRDIFTGDARKTYGNTEVGLGMRYEHTNNKDGLFERRNPGEANNTFLTQNDDLKADIFTGHGSAVTRFSDKFWASTGYSYTTLDTAIGGSRIYGQGYNAIFNPLGTAAIGQGNGFVGLTGGATGEQHVANLNLMWMPLDSLTITPELRIEDSKTDNSVDYVRTTASPQPANNRVHLLSGEELLNVTESLEARYSGINDWVFYARGDWEEENYNRSDNSNTAYSTTGFLNYDVNTPALRQKYTVGANWYALSNLNFAAQYYHKIEESKNIFNRMDTTADNQRMMKLKFNTDDLNVRATWRPLGNLSLVSRYDFQYSSIYSQWHGGSGVGTNFQYGLASLQTNHIFSETITWNPFSRMYIQGGGSYVLNKIHTPATDNVSPNIIQDARDNYWTLNFASGLALDDKTDIKAEYTYYRAEDYQNNAAVGMPYGTDSEEHTLSASISRQLSDMVRCTLKYAYDCYSDDTYGGQNDYNGHMVYASTEVRF